MIMGSNSGHYSKLAVCPLALGSQLQAVHGISILSAPSGLTGILCFDLHRIPRLSEAPWEVP